MRVLLLTLAALVAVVIVLVIARLWSAWSLLGSLSFRPGGARLVDPEALPRELDPIFRVGGEALERLGFRRVAALLIDSPETAEPPRPAHLWVHDESGTSATLTPPLFYNGSRCFDVAFETEYPDGAVLLTGDAIEHVMFPLPDGWTFQDGFRNDLDAQWRLHLAGLERSRERGAPLTPTADLVVERNERCLGTAPDRWRRLGLLAPDRAGHGGEVRLHGRAALAFGRRLVAGSDRIARLERARASGGPARPGPADAWRAAEIEAIERARTLEESRRGSKRSSWVPLLVSLPLSALALGILFGWDLVASLLLVLFVHELGHAAGMVLFGYRDPRIFFVPFLGAAATGSKDDATPFQELVVLLMGPVPGIVLGFWLLTEASPGSWWLELGMVAVVLNYLNLLPIMPLDGGRIVETVLLGRFPRAQFVFVAVSGLVAGWAGLVLGDPILQFLAVMLAISLPSKWRWSEGARRLWPHLRPGLDRGARVEAVYRVLDEPPFTRLAQAQRFQLAQSLLSFAARPRAGAVVVVLGMLLYAAAVVVPPAGYLLRTSSAPAPLRVLEAGP